MIYEGKAITVKALESGIVELKFDLKGESVNKFNRLTLNELRASVDAIKAAVEKVNTEAQAVGQAIYEASAAEGAQAGDAGATGSDDDDVVDAEVVDEDETGSDSK